MLNQLDYEVQSIHSLAPLVSQIFLRPRSSVLYYEAGQYIEVVHQDQSTSPLSIACMPNKNAELEFHLFHPPENHQALDLLRMAKEEKRWTILGPSGHCGVDRLHLDKPIIFIARGTGFAPIKAVIEALLNASFKLSIELYWSVAKQSHFYLLDEIAKWQTTYANFNFIPVLTKEKVDESSLSVEQLVLHNHPDLSSHQVYAAASRAFIYSLFYSLQKHGLQQEFFYSDVFGG